MKRLAEKALAKPAQAGAILAGGLMMMLFERLADSFTDHGGS